MDLLNELQNKQVSVFDQSYVKTDKGEACMIRKDGRTLLAVTDALQGMFHGEVTGEIKFCPTDHANRLVLNELFPYTKPVAFGRETPTFGFGDRLGYANPAQIRAIKKTQIRPVLAQQSLRELTLTGRTNTAVIDVAAWAVFREGYRYGFASDGDHLKTLDEVAAALKDGCTMITLDCSLVLNQTEISGRTIAESFDALPPQLQMDYLERYIHAQEPKQFGLQYTKESVYAIFRSYAGALSLIQDVYDRLLKTSAQPIDFEVSLDETVETTSAEAHYFVAREMEQMDVIATSVAPKFVGEFQKAIDYIGDLDEFKRTLAIHAQIADRFGYKLSLHSASEKYSVLPLVAEATHGHFHIKTSGTSWLEVVETIAMHAPKLYRQMHEVALQTIDEARKFYVVHCDTSRIAPLDETSDADLPKYLELGNNDARQLMHITYGFVLERPELKKQILQFLDDHFDLFEKEAEELYDRHLLLLS